MSDLVTVQWGGEFWADLEEGISEGKGGLPILIFDDMKQLFVCTDNELWPDSI